jgi:hypothetical protein
MKSKNNKIQIFNEHCIVNNKIRLYANFNWNEYNPEDINKITVLVNDKIINDIKIVISKKVIWRWSRKDSDRQFYIEFPLLDLNKSKFTFLIEDTILYENINLKKLNINVDNCFSSVMTMIQNDENRVQEWINYNFKLGFSKIIIFLNCSTDNTLKKINELNNNNIITIPFNYRAFNYGISKICFREIQCSLLSIFMNYIKSKINWVSWQDCDEFIILSNNNYTNNINNLLKKNENEIAINISSILCTNKEDIILNNNVFENCIYSDFKPNYKKFIVNLKKSNFDFFQHVHNVKSEKIMNFNEIHYRHCWVNNRCKFNDNMSNLNITTLITTSPIKSMPNISLIKTTINSLKLVNNLYESPIIICCDGGIRDKKKQKKLSNKCEQFLSESDIHNYNKYKQNLKEFIKDKLNIKIVELNFRGGLTLNLKNGMKYVNTKYVNIMQHDLPIIRSFSLNILDVINDHNIDLIRYVRKSNKFHEEYVHKIVNKTPFKYDEYVYNNILFTKCNQFSDNNHISTLDYYNTIIFPRCRDGYFMEDQLFELPILNKIPGNYMYLGGINDGGYIKHLNGRTFTV